MLAAGCPREMRNLWSSFSKIRAWKMPSQQSRRIGDLLLKNEQHEIAEISKLAADLLDREYR